MIELDAKNSIPQSSLTEEFVIVFKENLKSLTQKSLLHTRHFTLCFIKIVRKKATKFDKILNHLRSNNGDTALSLRVAEALHAARSLVEGGQTRSKVGRVAGVGRHLGQTT